MLLLVALAAAAQDVTITNLKVASDNTITFDISWGNRAGVWNDTVWVFIDYFNMDKQQMWRLPISSATLTNASRAGARVRMIAGNNAGFYIEGNANGTSAFTASVSVTPVGDYPAGVLRPCVYVTDYPPTATYGDLSGSSVTVNLTGTAPYSVQYSDGTSATLTSSSVSITNGNGIKVFVDATGNEGKIDCGAFCNDPWITLAVGTVTWSGVNVDQPNQFAKQADMYTSFYQWNQIKAWPATGAISGSWPAANTSPTWTVNPCPSGWRLPTLAEFQALHDGSIPVGGTWVAAGVKNSVNGRYYGPNSATCNVLDRNMTGCIFLPAVGYRLDGTLSYQSDYGWYWSSTQANTTSSYRWEFYSGNSSLTYSHKSFGFSIRCVKQ